MEAPHHTPATTERLHALDGLRAAMMLLGLVLHAAISYVSRPLGAAWPYSDADRSAVCDLLVGTIHLFRMPVFFVMAGFFAALLHRRRGALGLLRNRASRILVPFAAGWLLLCPLVVGGFTFASIAQWRSLTDALETAWTVTRVQPFVDSTMHLWFLYDLLFFYAFAAVLAALATRLPSGIIERSRHAFRALVTSPARALLLALPTTLTLLPMQSLGLDTTTSFVPEPRTLAAYFVFFGFGWLLYDERELVATFPRHAGRTLLAAALLVPVHFGAIETVRDDGDAGTRLLALGTAALIVWLSIFAITGLFVRFLHRPRPVVRYLVDSSYWLYLAHLPFTIWLPGLLADWRAPALLKASTVLLVMAPILLASYHFLVRGTWVGVLLNGRRYPVAVPWSSRQSRCHPPGTSAQPTRPETLIQ